MASGASGGTAMQSKDGTGSYVKKGFGREQRHAKDASMSSAQTSFRSAQMRLERAILNIKDVIDEGTPVGALQFRGSITRVVVALNTVAEALHEGADPEQVTELMWGFGEQLGISADGARG